MQQNPYFGYLIDPCFWGVNRLSVLSFVDNAHQTKFNWYFLPTVEIKNYNFMIDAKNVFGQPVTNDIRNYNIRKIVTSQGDEYTTCCLLHYVHFKKKIL